MRNRTKRFAPNKIDYIVAGSPRKAQRLIHNYGYQAPKDVQALSETMKLLVQRKGRKVVKDLLAIHPDKNILLRLNKPKEDSFCGACGNFSYLPEDNFCGACGHSNYTGNDLGKFLDRLVVMNTSELENYYQEIVKKANKNPENNILADEVQLVWNELRQRDDAPEAEEKTEEATPLVVLKSDLAIAGVLLVAGILIGTALRGHAKQ